MLTHGDLDHIGLVPRLNVAGVRVLLHPAEERSLRRPGAKKGDASPERMLLNLWRPSTLRGRRRDDPRQPSARALRRTGGDLRRRRRARRPRAARASCTRPATPRALRFLFEEHGALLVGDALCTHGQMSPDGRPALMPSFYNVDNAGARDALARIEPLEAEVIGSATATRGTRAPPPRCAAAKGQAPRGFPTTRQGRR